MKQLKTKILKNEEVAQGFYKMRLESAYLAKTIKPGQFVEIRCSDSLSPLLRRPFSVHRILKNGIEILYKIVGKGTEILSQNKTSDYLDVIGPLGNGFDIPYTLYPIPYTLLIAGGMGIAPLAALAEELAKKKANIYVIIGAKTKSHILCETEFTPRRCNLKVATEDGSKGHKGLAADLLKNLLTTHDSRLPDEARRAKAGLTTIYACGPNEMLKAVARIAMAERIPCQVSLEERMACGVGVCLGCPVKVRKKITSYELRVTGYEYKMVCKDGPVFNAEDIVW